MKTCPKCGGIEFYKKSGSCIPCSQEHHRELRRLERQRINDAKTCKPIDPMKWESLIEIAKYKPTLHSESVRSYASRQDQANP